VREKAQGSAVKVGRVNGDWGMSVPRNEVAAGESPQAWSLKEQENRVL